MPNMTAPVHSTGISRRTFLRAAGVCLALPWLESGEPGAAATAPPKRAVFVFLPNGVNMWKFHPETAGKDFALSDTLQPLAPVRDRLSILSGLQHRKIKGGHEEWAYLLTCNATGVGVASKHTAVRPNTISIDQHIANAIGEKTRWPSLVLGADGGRMTSSFDATGQPVLADFDLKAIFDDLTGADPNGRMAHRGSILDLVADQAKAKRAELGGSDQRKLDEYLDSVRSIEKRVQADQSFKQRAHGAIDQTRLHLQADPFKDADHTAYVDTLFELVVLAFQFDCTRVVSITTTRSEGGGPLKALDGGKDWHGQGHATNDEIAEKKPKEYAVLDTYDRFWHSRLTTFLQRLAGTSEGGQDLLRNTAVFFGRGMSWPAMHRSDNLPLILAGGEGLGFVQGRHLVFNNHPPLAPVNAAAPPPIKLAPDASSVSDLLRTISERMDVPAAGFGESRRTLDELAA